jgi:hypothetical protein
LVLSNFLYILRGNTWRGVLDTTLYEKVCQWLVTGRWFSPISSNKVTLNPINQAKPK